MPLDYLITAFSLTFRVFKQLLNNLWLNESRRRAVTRVAGFRVNCRGIG
jgi:hypothetical protein